MTTTTLAGLEMAHGDPFQIVRERIHTLIWRRKLTNAQVGACIGVGVATFGKKLRGEVSMTVPELLTVAGFLGVDPAELVAGCAIRDSNPEPADMEQYAFDLGVWSGVA